MFLTTIATMQSITPERAKELFDTVCAYMTRQDKEWTWKELISYEYIQHPFDPVLSDKLYELCDAIMFYVGGPCDIWYTPKKDSTKGIVSIINRGYYYNIGA